MKLYPEFIGFMKIVLSKDKKVSVSFWLQKSDRNGYRRVTKKVTEELQPVAEAPEATAKR